MKVVRYCTFDASVLVVRSLDRSYDSCSYDPPWKLQVTTGLAASSGISNSLEPRPAAAKTSYPLGVLVYNSRAGCIGRTFKLMLGVLESTQGPYLRTLSRALALGLDRTESTSSQSVPALRLDVQDAELLKLPKGEKLASYLLLAIESRR